MDDFEYSFASYARIIEELLNHLEIEKHSLYLIDYGAPVGWTLSSKYPDKIETLIV